MADIFIVGRIHNFYDNKDAFPDLQSNYTLHPCSYLTQRLAVFWDGIVTTCCMDYNMFNTVIIGIDIFKNRRYYMRNKRIYLSPPHMSGKELTMVKNVFKNNWIAPSGPDVNAFEKEFVKKNGSNRSC